MLRRRAGYALFASDTDCVRALAAQCGATYFAASGLGFARRTEAGGS
jgi:hypothetical protein